MSPLSGLLPSGSYCSSALLYIANAPQETLKTNMLLYFAENSKQNKTKPLILPQKERKILDWVSEQEIELRNLRVFTEDSFFLKYLFLLFVCVLLCGGLYTYAHVSMVARRGCLSPLEQKLHVVVSCLV